MCQIWLRSDGRVDKKRGVQTDRQRETAALYNRCFVDRGVLLGGGESVILWNKFFCCFANSQLLVVCMHVCEHTTSHHFNVKIALHISGLGALHTGRDAL